MRTPIRRLRRTKLNGRAEMTLGTAIQLYFTFQ
jgi:hypothetical protein